MWFLLATWLSQDVVQQDLSQLLQVGCQDHGGDHTVAQRRKGIVRGHQDSQRPLFQRYFQTSKLYGLCQGREVRFTLDEFYKIHPWRREHKVGRYHHLPNGMHQAIRCWDILSRDGNVIPGK